MRIICQQIVVGLVVFIAQTVYALHHSKYRTLQFAALMLWLTTLTASTCFFYFKIDNLPKHTFFLPSPQKLLFAILSPFQLNFIQVVTISPKIFKLKRIKRK